MSHLDLMLRGMTLKEAGPYGVALAALDERWYELQDRALRTHALWSESKGKGKTLEDWTNAIAELCETESAIAHLVSIARKTK